eukprot:30591-Pelagococcus_subviridis.AAC.2
MQRDAVEQTLRRRVLRRLLRRGGAVVAVQLTERPRVDRGAKVREPKRLLSVDGGSVAAAGRRRHEQVARLHVSMPDAERVRQRARGDRLPDELAQPPAPARRRAAVEPPPRWAHDAERRRGEDFFVVVAVAVVVVVVAVRVHQRRQRVALVAEHEPELVLRRVAAVAASDLERGLVPRDVPRAGVRSTLRGARRRSNRLAKVRLASAAQADVLPALDEDALQDVPRRGRVVGRVVGLGVGRRRARRCRAPHLAEVPARERPPPGAAIPSRLPRATQRDAAEGLQEPRDDGDFLPRDARRRLRRAALPAAAAAVAGRQRVRWHPREELERGARGQAVELVPPAAAAAAAALLGPVSEFELVLPPRDVDVVRVSDGRRRVRPGRQRDDAAEVERDARPRPAAAVLRVLAGRRDVARPRRERRADAHAERGVERDERALVVRRGGRRFNFRRGRRRRRRRRGRRDVQRRRRLLRRHHEHRDVIAAVHQHRRARRRRGAEPQPREDADLRGRSPRRGRVVAAAAAAAAAGRVVVAVAFLPGQPPRGGPAQRDDIASRGRLRARAAPRLEVAQRPSTRVVLLRLPVAAAERERTRLVAGEHVGYAVGHEHDRVVLPERHARRHGRVRDDAVPPQRAVAHRAAQGRSIRANVGVEFKGVRWS